MELTSAAALLAFCEAEGKTIPEAVITYESILSADDPEAIRHHMQETLEAMRESAAKGLDDPGAYAHLAKGYGQKMREAARQNRLVGDTQLQRIAMYSLGVAQHNASLGRIVACPTAGSCGVVPGALLGTVGQDETDERLVEALFTAAAIGTVSAAQGPISGAEGGCQAECGVASAMAAGSLMYLMGGSSQQIFDAASLALQNLLGLVCDPIASLVEVPCITRNACAAANAVLCADMIAAGIPAVVPFDETVHAMKLIGRSMPESLRETARGGLAATPTGRRLSHDLKQAHQLKQDGGRTHAPDA